MPKPTDAPFTPLVAHTARGDVEYAVLGTGTPVLVLHGTPGGIDAAESMSRVLPRDKVASIVLSRPGYLGTELGDRLTPDDQADLYAALLDELHIDTAGVLAWSGAGPSAYRFAAAHSNRVTSLVALACLSASWVNPKPDLSSRLLTGTRAGDWFMHKLAAVQPKAVVQGVLSSEGDLTKEEFAAEVDFILADESRTQFVLDTALAASQVGARKAGWDNDCAQFAKPNSLQLEDITVPVLLVQGSADADVSPDHSVRAHERIPGSELVTLDRGTHLAFFTHPEAEAAQAKALEYLLATRP